MKELWRLSRSMACIEDLKKIANSIQYFSYALNSQAGEAT